MEIDLTKVRDQRDQLEGSAKSAAKLILERAEHLGCEIDRVKDDYICAVDEQLAMLTTKYKESEQQLVDSTNCFSSGVVAVARRQKDVDWKRFDPKCALVVHGLMPESGVEDVDVFQALCSKYFHFTPGVRREACRRFGHRRSPLLIVCQDETDALRVLTRAKRTFRLASGVSVVRYQPWKWRGKDYELQRLWKMTHGICKN